MQFENLSVINGVTLHIKSLALVILQMCWVDLPNELQCTPLNKTETSEILCLLLMT